MVRHCYCSRAQHAIKCQGLSSPHPGERFDRLVFSTGAVFRGQSEVNAHRGDDIRVRSGRVAFEAVCRSTSVTTFTRSGSATAGVFGWRWGQLLLVHNRPALQCTVAMNDLNCCTTYAENNISPCRRLRRQTESRHSPSK
jgi:hypothetical protein